MQTEKQQPCGFLETVWNPVSFTIVFGVVLLIIAFAGSRIIAEESQLCQKHGGVYVKVYSGFECIKDNKIISIERK